MANQLKMAFIDAILTLHGQGWSQRAIARRLDVHRETVSRHVRLAASISKPANMHAGDLLPPASVPASPPRHSYCDRFRDTIEAKLAVLLDAMLADCGDTEECRKLVDHVLDKPWKWRAEYVAAVCRRDDTNRKGAV